MKHHLSDLYQVCSNYAPWAKLPCPKDHMFYKGLYRNLHGKILSKSTRHRALVFGYVASPSGPLPKLFKLCSCGQKWARPRGHRFCIGLYRENMNKSLNMRKQTHLSKFHCLDFFKCYSSGIVLFQKIWSPEPGLIDIFVPDRLGSNGVINTI